MARRPQTERKLADASRAAADPETEPFWDAAGEGKLLIKRCTRLRQGALVSARALPVLLQRPHRMGGGPAGHDLHLQRDAPRAGALRASPM